MPLFRYPAHTHDCLKGGSRRAAEWDGGKKSITSDFTLLRVTTAAAVWQETVMLTIHGQVRTSSSNKPLDAELSCLTLISAQLREREREKGGGESERERENHCRARGFTQPWQQRCIRETSVHVLKMIQILWININCVTEQE